MNLDTFSIGEFYVETEDETDVDNAEDMKDLGSEEQISY